MMDEKSIGINRLTGQPCTTHNFTWDTTPGVKNQGICSDCDTSDGIEHFIKIKEGRKTDTFDESYCSSIIEHMASGYSIESYAGIIGVSRKTLYNWMDKHADFKEAVEIGSAKSQFFWEKIGIKGTVGMPLPYKTPNGDTKMTEKFNPVSWIFNMKNRFNWKDRQDITSDDEKIDAPVIYKPQKYEESEDTHE